MAIVVVSFSPGGVLSANWLASSIERQNAKVVRVSSVAESEDETHARRTAERFREGDAVVAVLTREDAGGSAVVFDYGVAVGLGKKFLSLVPDEASLEALPQALRRHGQVMGRSPDETAIAVLGAANAA